MKYDIRNIKGTTGPKQLLKRVVGTFAVVVFGFFLAILPAIIGKSGEGIFSVQTASAAPICYNGAVEYKEESKCQDDVVGDKPSGDACFKLESRRSTTNNAFRNEYYYTKIDCPVNPESIKNESPKCMKDGDLTKCGDDQKKGKCYNWRKGVFNKPAGWDEVTCTTAYFPNAQTSIGGDESGEPNRCYTHEYKKTDCPQDKQGNEGLCYLQRTPQRNQTETYNRTPCDEVLAKAGEVSEEENDPPGCEERAKLSSGWIVCSALELLSSGMDTLAGYVDDMLNVDVVKLDNDGGLRSSWSFFRAVATFMLVAIGLVMIISQAIGGGN